MKSKKLELSFRTLGAMTSLPLFFAAQSYAVCTSSYEEASKDVEQTSSAYNQARTPVDENVGAFNKLSALQAEGKEKLDKFKKAQGEAYDDLEKAGQKQLNANQAAASSNQALTSANQALASAKQNLADAQQAQRSARTDKPGNSAMHTMPFIGVIERARAAMDQAQAQADQAQAQASQTQNQATQAQAQLNKLKTQGGESQKQLEELNQKIALWTKKQDELLKEKIQPKYKELETLQDARANAANNFAECARLRAITTGDTAMLEKAQGNPGMHVKFGTTYDSKGNLVIDTPDPSTQIGGNDKNFVQDDPNITDDLQKKIRILNQTQDATERNQIYDQIKNDLHAGKYSVQDLQNAATAGKLSPMGASFLKDILDSPPSPAPQAESEPVVQPPSAPLTSYDQLHHALKSKDPAVLATIPALYEAVRSDSSITDEVRTELKQLADSGKIAPKVNVEESKFTSGGDNYGNYISHGGTIIEQQLSGAVKFTDAVGNKYYIPPSDKQFTKNFEIKDDEGNPIGSPIIGHPTTNRETKQITIETATATIILTPPKNYSAGKQGLYDQVEFRQKLSAEDSSWADNVIVVHPDSVAKGSIDYKRSVTDKAVLTVSPTNETATFISNQDGKPSFQVDNSERSDLPPKFLSSDGKEVWTDYNQTSVGAKIDAVTKRKLSSVPPPAAAPLPYFVPPTAPVSPDAATTQSTGFIDWFKRSFLKAREPSSDAPTQRDQTDPPLDPGPIPPVPPEKPKAQQAPIDSDFDSNGNRIHPAQGSLYQPAANTNILTTAPPTDLGTDWRKFPKCATRHAGTTSGIPVYTRDLNNIEHGCLEP